MLVFSRKVDEEFFIFTPEGRAIRVVYVENQRNKIRIGVDAPKDILVCRAELMDQSQFDLWAAEKSRGDR